MKESELQRRIIVRCKSKGMMAFKVDVYKAGFPDLLIIEDGHIWLAEVKTAKGRLTPMQKSMHERIRAMNVKCVVIRSEDEI